VDGARVHAAGSTNAAPVHSGASLRGFQSTRRRSTVRASHAAVRGLRTKIERRRTRLAGRRPRTRPAHRQESRTDLLPRLREAVRGLRDRPVLGVRLFPEELLLRKRRADKHCAAKAGRPARGVDARPLIRPYRSGNVAWRVSAGPSRSDPLYFYDLDSRLSALIVLALRVARPCSPENDAFGAVAAVAKRLRPLTMRVRPRERRRWEPPDSGRWVTTGAGRPQSRPPLSFSVRPECNSEQANPIWCVVTEPTDGYLSAQCWRPKTSHRRNVRAGFLTHHSKLMPS
jgi:hypothetical protein